MIKMEQCNKTPLQTKGEFHNFREHPSQCQSCHQKVDVAIRMSKTLETRCYYQSAKVTTRKSMLPSKCQSCHQTFKIAGRIAILRSESDAHGSLPRGDFAATGGDLLVALLGLSSTVAVVLSQSVT